MESPTKIFIFSNEDFPLILATDIDDTLVNHSQESNEDLLHFNRIWQTHFADNSLLLYTTRGTPAAFEDLKTKVPLLTPKNVICSLGTEIYHREDYRGFRIDYEWRMIMSKNWDRNAIFRLIISLGIQQLTLREKSEQRNHKISFKLDTATDKTDPAAIVERIRNVLEHASSNAKAVLSDNLYIDIVPKFAGKGTALQYLLNKFEKYHCFPRLGVQVNGISGDDIDLFKVRQVKSCAVGNSTEELIQWVHDHPSPNMFMAKQQGAAGIIEGMRHYGFLTEELDSKRKIESHIYASLDSRFRNQQSTGSVLSESFVFEKYIEEIQVKDGIIDLPKELGITPSPLLYIDNFRVTKLEDSIGRYSAYYEVSDLSKNWGAEYKLCGSLKVHMDSQMIIWERLGVEMERKWFDLTSDVC